MAPGTRQDCSTRAKKAPLTGKVHSTHRGPMDGITPRLHTRVMSASKIGEVGGESAMLNLILADAEVASGLGGHDGTDEGMEAVHAALRTLDAENRGLLVDAGASHVADVWSLDGGFAITSFYPEDDDPDPVVLGELVASLDAKDSEHEGSVEVVSGTLAVMLEYQPGSDISPELLAKAGVRELPNGLLVPCPNGTYEVYRDALEHESDLGTLEVRVRLVHR